MSTAGGREWWVDSASHAVQSLALDSFILKLGRIYSLIDVWPEETACLHIFLFIG